LLVAVVVRIAKEIVVAETLVLEVLEVVLQVEPLIRQMECQVGVALSRLVAVVRGMDLQVHAEPVALVEKAVRYLVAVAVAAVTLAAAAGMATRVVIVGRLGVVADLRIQPHQVARIPTSFIRRAQTREMAKLF
jgi:hypothetical protein